MLSHRVLGGIFSSLVTTIACAAGLQGALESPANGAIESGIGIVRGWHCTASVIEVKIDGISRGKTYVGSNRFDAASICGKIETGFSLLLNYNDTTLTPGNHVVRVYGDGVLFGEALFQNVQSGGQEYLTGVTKQTTVNDFPRPGSSVVLSWREDKQNFVVTNISLNQQRVRAVISLVSFVAGTDGSTRISFTVTNNTTSYIGKVDLDLYCTSGSTGLTFLKSTSYIPAYGMIFPGASEVGSLFYYSPGFVRTAPPHCSDLNTGVFVNPTSIYDASGAIIY